MKLVAVTLLPKYKIDMEKNVTINIQGGRPGIELQESFFKIKQEKKEAPPSYAYLVTRLLQDNITVRFSLGNFQLLDRGIDY